MTFIAMKFGFETPAVKQHCRASKSEIECSFVANKGFIMFLY